MGSRKRSAVWNHFEEVEPKKAKCLYCANMLNLPAENCGNLSRHLKSKHPTVSLVAKRQPTQQACFQEAPQDTLAATSTVTESVTSSAPACGPSSVELPPHQSSIKEYAHSTKSMPTRRAELLDEQLVRMIANGYYPFSIVEDEEFKKFVHMLCPGYTLPTRKTLSQTSILKMCKKTGREIEA
ncbi:unnamed protein product [Parnassius mnemosyne]|uniref:BED-type domain-containing protein n=1 Tax=Parnassius mnemosyne TaxID=213953 RepID=A0AAV1K888_9NEOP